jgi:signal transduction histidine kinase
MRVNAAARHILGLDAAPPSFDQLPVPERLALYGARDEQGRPVAPEDWPIVRALRGEVGDGIGAEVRYVQMRALDGRETEITFSTAPLRDREGQLVGVVNVLHDQTERRRLAREAEAARADELAAREASRRLEAFLATAVHDLRSPLTATLGFIGLAEHASERLASAARAACPDLAPRVEAVRGRLGDAGQSAERLSRLLTLLFDTAAIRADKLEIHRAPCDLAALVREQVAWQRVAAPGRTITLHLPAGGKPILVEADADRIGQVVTNYLTNALKYSPADRPVEVGLAVDGQQARVWVRDQGPGLRLEEQERIWERFHRVKGIEVQSGSGIGLGLGLHICRTLIERHHGQVGVQSAPGQGSIFWFTLPRAVPADNQESSRERGERVV